MQQVFFRMFSTGAPTASNPVLRLYREMLRLAENLTPKTRSIDATKRIREGFRQNRSVSDPDQLAELLKGANSRLNFLRAATPHRRGERGSFVIVNGRLVEGKADRVSRHSFMDKRVTDEQIKRHYALMRKQRAIGM